MEQGMRFGVVAAAWLVASGACAQVDGAARAPRFVESALLFESNVGQAAPRFRFVAHRGQHALAIDGQGGLSLMTREGGLEMKLVAARSPSAVRGESLAIARVNVLHGAPADWVRGAPTYARVRAVGVYPGVDLVHHAANGQPEYDFEVAPGADPTRIRLRFEGGLDARLLADGSLVHHLPHGELRQCPPHAYQDIAGQRREVPVAFRLDHGELSFALGAYDHDAPLVIDPVVIFATYLGGSEDERFGDMAVSESGKIAVVGTTLSPDLVVVSASQESLGYMGVSDAFISLYRADGVLAFTTYFGGWARDEANAVAIERSGRVWVAGSTRSLAPEDLPDPHGGFPLTPDAVDRHGYDGGAFLTLLDAAGGLVYSTFLGLDDAHPITPQRLLVTSRGELLMAGAGALPDGFGGVVAGAADAGFVGGLGTDGRAIWGATLAGAGVRVRGLLPNGVGGAWVSGDAQTFASTESGYVPTGAESGLAFVARFEAAGSTTTERSYVLGEGSAVALAASADSVYALSRADAAGSVFAPAPASAAAWAALSRFGADGTLMATARVLPSSVGVWPEDMLSLESGALLVTGAAQNDGLFDRAFGGEGGGRDAFMAELSVTDSDTLATDITWATLYGGAEEDVALRLGADAHGSFVVAGQTSSPDLVLTTPAHQQGGAADVFVLSVGSEVRRDALARTTLRLTVGDSFPGYTCGRAVDLSLDVVNTGGALARGVRVAGSAEFAPGGDFSSNPRCVYTRTPSGANFECDMRDLPVGDRDGTFLTVHFADYADAGVPQTVVVRAEASADNAPPNLQSGTASDLCSMPRDLGSDSSFGGGFCGRCGVAAGHTRRLGWLGTIAFGLLLYWRRRR